MAKKSPLIISLEDIADGELGMPNAVFVPSIEFKEAVSDANGALSKFVYTADEIVKLAIRAERRLDRSGLTKTKRAGIELTAQHAGPGAKAYRYSSSSRRVTIRRNTKGWVLVSLDETRVFPTQGERISYRASAAQIEDIQRRATDDFSVKP